MKNVIAADSLGECFGHDLYRFEVDYLIEHEWARSAEDILWRRTKMGLFLNSKEKDILKKYITEKHLT